MATRTPVDYDPFAANAAPQRSGRRTPVDYDPFDPGFAKTMILGASQGGSLGFADEIEGLAAASQATPATRMMARSNPVTGLVRNVLPDNEFGRAAGGVLDAIDVPFRVAAGAFGMLAAPEQATPYYDNRVSEVRDEIAAARAARPWQMFGAELAGGAALAIATGGGGAAVNTLGGAAWQGAKIGAGTGAVYGAGTAEGGVGERAWGAAKGAAVGAVAGAALPVVAAPVVGLAQTVARPFLGRSGAYQKLASQMELDGSLATMGDNIAAGAQTAAHPIERRALDVLGDEMLRTRNAAAARTATADRLAAEFRITTAEAADHIAELEARQAASPLFFGEHPNIGPRDSMAAALQRGSHPTPRDHAAERFVRTPEETATSQVVDYLANSGGQAARRVRSGIAQRNAALPDEVTGALQRMQPPHMQPMTGADEAVAIGDRLARTRSGPIQANRLAQFDAMLPDEQAAAQIGWIQAQIGKLQDLPDGADAARLLGNETTRQVAERLFGRQAVLELQRALTSVRVANQSARRIGGSQTYARGEMRRAMDGEINAVAAADSLSVGVVRKWLADMAALAMRGRRNEYIADVVMTPMRDMPQVASHLAQLRRTQATTAQRAAAAAAGRTGTARIGTAARAMGAAAAPVFNALANHGDRR